jgi:hypothetical protein
MGHVTRIIELGKANGTNVGVGQPHLGSPDPEEWPPGPTLFHLAYTCIEILHGHVELVIG